MAMSSSEIAFRYRMPLQEIVLEPGIVDRIGELARPLGTRAFLVTTPRIGQSQLFRRVVCALGESCVGTFARVQRHAPTGDTEEAAGAASLLNADVLVSVGGGSCADTAKGIALLLAEGGVIKDHSAMTAPPWTAPDLVNIKVPIIAVPTTASGAEMTPGGAAMTPDGIKRSFWDTKLACRLILLDPDATAEVPIIVTAVTAMNGVAHGVEGLYTLARNPISEMLAIECLRLFSRALPELVKNPKDVIARSHTLLAAALGGMVIANANSALHHAVCHVLGARTGILHGDANAIMLPHVMRYNLDSTIVEQARIARIFGASEDDDDQAAEEASLLLARFAASVGAPRMLREVGVDRAVLPVVASEALQEPGLAFNPKPVSSADDLLGILEKAW
jgi:alcohol dehydrogenase